MELTVKSFEKNVHKWNWNFLFRKIINRKGKKEIIKSLEDKITSKHMKMEYNMNYFSQT